MGVRVVTPAVTEPVSLAEAKLHVRADSDITVEDALITGYVQAARAECEQLLRRTIAPATLLLTLNAFPDGDLVLPRGPVSTVSWVRYAHPTTGVMTTLDPAQYVLQSEDDGDALRLAFGAVWPSHRAQAGAVTVQYVAGWATCPEAIRSWILLRVGTLYRYREADAERVPEPSAFVNRLVDRYKAFDA